MADAPRVFISYSNDSDEHADYVLALADALCDGGIDVILDRYVRAPDEGWPRWMDRNIDEAQFVLMVCTETYRRRVMGQEEPGKGTGVRWEGKLIFNRICYDKPAGAQFIPILLPGSKPELIPDAVRGHNRYVLAAFDLSDPQYEVLYRHLTDQPATPRPDLGSIKKLPPKPRLWRQVHSREPGQPLPDFLHPGLMPISTEPDGAFWEGGVRPEWAADWGRDPFGAWAAFQVGGVTQKLRWIPPGKFLMGSPDNEEG